jgi:DNA-binding transcriptional regulator YdaS (Cro superfamily)
MNVVRILERRVQAAGSQKKAATELGISAQYLNDLLQGRRDFSDNLLEKLGLERKIVRMAR